MHRPEFPPLYSQAEIDANVAAAAAAGIDLALLIGMPSLVLAAFSLAATCKLSGWI